jgi:hypothetical protein
MGRRTTCRRLRRQRDSIRDQTRNAIATLDSLTTDPRYSQELQDPQDKDYDFQRKIYTGQ